MSWRETGREVTNGWTFVMWRCSWCGRMAVSGGFAPSPCVCTQPKR